MPGDERAGGGRREVPARILNTKRGCPKRRDQKVMGIGGKKSKRGGGGNTGWSDQPEATN